MTRADYVVSCPYCRRQYRMKLDRDEVTQKRTRATCGRCGNSFELAPRITVPGAAALAPPLPTPAARRPPPAPKPAERVVEFTAEAEDEDDIGRAVAEAADQIVAELDAPPVVIGAVRKTSTRIAAQTSSPPQTTASRIAAQLSSPEIPVLAASSPSIAAATSSSKVARQSSSQVAAQRSSPKIVVEAPAPKTDPAIPARPLTWLERADPGLTGLREEPSPAALALEELL